MTTESAMRALEKLTSMSASYDVRRTTEYAQLMKEFMNRAERYKRTAGLMGGGKPFIDVTEGLVNALPPEVQAGFDAWSAGAKITSASKQMCYAYLKSL